MYRFLKFCSPVVGEERTVEIMEQSCFMRYNFLLLHFPPDSLQVEVSTLSGFRGV
jgi:hypothetical protein